MGPTPFYGARAEKPPFCQKKQTNICRLSGDINYSGRNTVRPGVNSSSPLSDCTYCGSEEVNVEGHGLRTTGINDTVSTVACCR